VQFRAVAMAVRAVFLVGFMACGKSSLGQQLAQRLDWDFVDLDAHIEDRERRTIAEIFQERGEPGFRAAESSALRELADSLNCEAFSCSTVSRNTVSRNTVVALGGGTFAQAMNRELLRPWPTVFLDAPVDELWERSREMAATRPLRKDRTEFVSLHQERLLFYRQAAVTIVTSGKDPTSLCAEIERSLQSWGKVDEGNADASGSVTASPDDFETGERS
jgi:shikimate kinase